MNKEKSCGIFRNCFFSADEKMNWIVVLDHAHNTGNLVNIRTKDNGITAVKLSEPLVVVQDGKPVPNCFRIYKNPRMTAVTKQKDADEVVELERMMRLPHPKSVQ